ncbi:protein-L-isoaspartate O-methyltransferase family protein [Erythrobacter sp.]|jgi:protein-L-isoaspartate(D-aspartate) O-methyltransferase|uniref:protein-L-isoaspartate O-methyltransferase family protein n=1 Tax=Erythrobacter sp. TaxID=1042 RepID=UPI002EC23D33|nr:protein-L-isoaspartate O-methyltransferase [Erythrobacter sp.]
MDRKSARKAMIDSQLRTSGVNEEFALARMMAVPREDFLPVEKAGLAYIDRSIALGEGAHLAAPLFYGKLLIEAVPDASDRVLIVSGGTDYLKALVEPMVGEVTSITAREVVEGSIPGGDYTLVFIDGAVERLPDALGEAVADGGRIVGGLLLRGVTRLASGRKIAGQIALEPVEDIGIPVLHAFDRPKSWSFS